MQVSKCPECQSDRLNRDYVKGELVCSVCGLIIDENIEDPRPDPIYDYEDAQKKAHTGAPSKLSKLNKGLTTEIDMYNRDIHGHKISSSKQNQFHRMRKWHRRAMVGVAGRNLAIALSELDRVSSALSLSDSIRESTALLYRKALEADLIRGRQIEAIVSGCLYAVCRMQGVPRTLGEISDKSGLQRKDVGRAYRYVRQELGMRVPLTNPADYVPKFTAALKLTGYVQEDAIALIKKAGRKGMISGRGPTSMAAAAVYIAANMRSERRTQTEVADVAGITEVTIRNLCRELKRQLHLRILF